MLLRTRVKARVSKRSQQYYLIAPNVHYPLRPQTYLLNLKLSTFMSPAAAANKERDSRSMSHDFGDVR